MNIESKWLEDFLALSNTKSFSQAARLRHITQPAFSRRIKALEEAVGAELIDRENLPITLTSSGKIFHITARNLINQMNNSVSMLEELSSEETHSVKVAAAHSLATFLALKLSNFHSKSDREVVLNIEAIDVDKATATLEQGACDLLIAFDNERLKLPPFSHQKIGSAELLPVSACNANGKAIYNLESDGFVPHLAYSLDSYMGRQLEPIISGSKLKKVFVSSMTELLKIQALEGNGIAWLPNYVITKELKEKSLVVVGQKHHCVPITYYAYRYHAALHPGGESVWNKLKELNV